MRDRYFAQYEEEMNNRNTPKDFVRVKDSLIILENIFRVSSMKYGWLPSEFDNRFFKEQFIRRKSARPFRNDMRWASHIASLRTEDNQNIVLFSPSPQNKLTEKGSTMQEQMDIMYKEIAIDVLLYNEYRSEYLPELEAQFLRLSLYSPENLSIIVFNKGLFEGNEEIQKYFHRNRFIAPSSSMK